MSTTIEFEIKVPGGSRIIGANVRLEDGKSKLILEFNDNCDSGISTTTTEFEIKDSSGRRMIDANVKLVDDKCKLILEFSDDKFVFCDLSKFPGCKSYLNYDNTLLKLKNVISDNYFVFCNLSELSLDDEFMKYEPKTEIGIKFKLMLVEAIEHGLIDIWCPKYDMFFTDETFTQLQFVPAKLPLRFSLEYSAWKSYDWWFDAARKFCPERGSRLGKLREYIGFCGWLIKKLIENGWTRKDAWNEICNRAKNFEYLVRVRKILSKDEDDSREHLAFFEVGGYFDDYGDFTCLAHVKYGRFPNSSNRNATGWVICEVA